MAKKRGRCSYVSKSGVQCPRPHTAKGLCQMHFLRQKRGQDMDLPPLRRPTGKMARILALAEARAKAQSLPPCPECGGRMGKHKKGCPQKGGRGVVPAAGLGVVQALPNAPQGPFLLGALGDAPRERLNKISVLMGISPATLACRILEDWLSKF